MSAAYITDGRHATRCRQKARRAVRAGHAEWVAARPPLATPPVVKRLPAVEVRQPATPPVRHVRRGFGEGLGERNPVYRSVVSAEDRAWWEEEANREQDRLIDRMYAEYRAQERMDAGIEAY